MTKKETNILIIGFTLIVALFIVAIYFAKVQIESTNSAIEKLANNIEVLAKSKSNNMDTATLDRLVHDAMDHRIKSEAQAIIDVKKQKYALAEENIKDNRRIYGNPKARFTLVEFSDTECPYCKRFHDTPKQLVERSNGNVNWEYMHLPLGFHNPVAETQATASECAGNIAGNQMFWVFLDEIFTQSRGGGQGVPDLTKVAVDLGIKKEDFIQCMASDKARNKVFDDMNKAQSFGISGTPATFVVDNLTGKNQLLSGAQPAESFMSVIRVMSEDKGN